MAHTIRLENGWRLTDGVLAPFALPALTDVKAALTERGVLPRDARGLRLADGEWIYARRWEYACAFDTPEEDDERLFVHLEHVYGAGEVFVNGASVGGFPGGAFRADITPFVRDAKNELTLRFDAQLRLPGEADYSRPLGVTGRVFLETGNCASLVSCDVTCVRGIATARVALDAFVSGKYVFRYTFTPEDGESEAFEFTERLRACRREITHEMKLKKPVEYRRELFEETAYLTRLDIERAGLGCARWDGCVPNYAPDARARFAAGICRADENALALLEEMGADGVLCADEPFEPARHGFLPVRGDDYLPLRETALAREEDMAALSGDEKFWPAGGAMWRLTGGDAFDGAAMEALFGVNASGDARRAANFTRFLQAETVLRKCLRARADGARVLFQDAADDAFRFASPALIEYGGAARPAYSAALMALLPSQALCDAPLYTQKGALARIRVGLTGAREATMYGVTAECFDMRGASMAAISLPVYAEGAKQAGELTVHLPARDDCAVVRVTAKDDRGAVAAKVDFTLCWGEDKAPMAYLMNPARTELRREGDNVVNAGQAVALGVATGAYYGALLPGETCPVKKRARVECLNAFLREG